MVFWKEYVQCTCLVFVGKQEAAEATLEALKVVPEPLGKWATILVEICAYAGKETLCSPERLLYSHLLTVSLNRYDVMRCDLQCFIYPRDTR